jgi:hypothetical protein
MADITAADQEKLTEAAKAYAEERVKGDPSIDVAKETEKVAAQLMKNAAKAGVDKTLEQIKEDTEILKNTRETEEKLVKLGGQTPEDAKSRMINAAQGLEMVRQFPNLRDNMTKALNDGIVVTKENIEKLEMKDKSKLSEKDKSKLTEAAKAYAEERAKGDPSIDVAKETEKVATQLMKNAKESGVAKTLEQIKEDTKILKDFRETEEKLGIKKPEVPLMAQGLELAREVPSLREDIVRGIQKRIENDKKLIGKQKEGAKENAPEKPNMALAAVGGGIAKVAMPVMDDPVIAMGRMVINGAQEGTTKPKEPPAPPQQGRGPR